ncbi:hypothetical protein ACEWFN_27525, partial [Klebsiella quasipneumoniae]
MPHSVRPTINRPPTLSEEPMTTVRMTIPDDFILGAAASAWQT